MSSGNTYLRCPGCNGSAVFTEGEAFGHYLHTPECKYNLEAQIMARKAEKRFTAVSSERQITRDIHEHEVFLSFLNDDDAEFFSEWWHGEGCLLFQKFLDSREVDDQ